MGSLLQSIQIISSSKERDGNTEDSHENQTVENEEINEDSNDSKDEEVEETMDEDRDYDDVSHEEDAEGEDAEHNSKSEEEDPYDVQVLDNDTSIQHFFMKFFVGYLLDNL